MKTLFYTLLAFPFITLAQVQTTTLPVINLKLSSKDIQEIINKPEVRPQVDQIKSTLSIGSDEDLIQIVKTVNPEIIKKVISLNIRVSPEQAKQLENLAMNNKGKLAAALVIGFVPEDLIAEAEKIVPELGKLKKEEKAQVFKAASKTANKLIFDKMVKAEVQLGYLAGDVSSGVVAQINAKLLNLKTIKIGDVEIQNVHMQVEAGYPKNGVLLISGEVKVGDSKFKYKGDLLGLSHDIRKHLLEVKIAEARVTYNILPWLFGHGALGIGVRNYADGVVFAFDPKLGIKAKTKLGPVKVEAFVEGTYRVAENNPVLSCGTTAGLEILKNDILQMQTGIISQVNLEANPRDYGNKVEWFNGAGLSGHF